MALTQTQIRLSDDPYSETIVTITSSLRGIYKEKICSFTRPNQIINEQEILRLEVWICYFGISGLTSLAPFLPFTEQMERQSRAALGISVTYMS